MKGVQRCFAPQVVQNKAPGRIGAPQAVQQAFASLRTAGFFPPQSGQNSSLAGLSDSHCGQIQPLTETRAGVRFGAPAAAVPVGTLPGRDQLLLIFSELRGDAPP